MEENRVLVLSYGNSLFKKTRFHPEEKDYRRLVSDLILKTYKYVGYDAINVGEYDLTLGVDYLKRWQKRMSLPFISANLEMKEGGTVFPPFRIVRIGRVKVGILGLIKERIHLSRVPDGNLYRVTDPVEAARREIEILKSKQVNFIILLTDMTAMGCKKVVSQDLPIDVVIGSSRYNRFSLPKVYHRRIILHLDRYGKRMGKLMLFCHGKGEGEWMPPENDFMSEKSFRNIFVNLKKDFPQDEKIARLMDIYLDKIRMLKAQIAISHGNMRGTEPTTKKRNRGYVGVDVCKKCHVKEYEHWLETRHSKAYLSLVKRGSQFDGDCVGCHMVGFRERGGISIISKAAMAPFVNVQCEACHGPGGRHVETGGDTTKIQRYVSRKTCLKCHTEERSPDFIYRVYFTRLSCGKNLRKQTKN